VKVEDKRIRRNQRTTQKKKRTKQNPKSTLAIAVADSANTTVVSALARGEVILTQCTAFLSISPA